ncbi:ABC transporter permease [Paenibacillus lignilyticus]|uniref:ABC transporter permease subunit n=1 Tax=Paenibacillus lignilyticus TaxID=1172615 RepID=A0ABS5CHX7_9BACL|nr:ABC transporter permease subunit [Paenibacillus lignilyticus]MBP3965474.1 ABC transporter permease subunit [Paenibacillus lignilyticus]
MNRWLVLFGKEWTELIRSYKLVWVPLVYILFGAMQPVSTYFLPDILAHAGNLPEGALISIPQPSASEVMAQTLQQFNTIGLLVLALSVMGSISAERTNGVTAMILVKPISYLSFVSAKWAAMLVLVTLAFAGGFGAAWYYTAALFETVDWQRSLYAYLLFLLWLSFAGSLTLLFSALLRSGAAAAACALGTAAVLALTASAFPHALAASPGMLPKFAYVQFAPTPSGQDSPWPAVCVAIGIMVAIMTIAAWSLRRRPSLDTL